MAGDTVAHLNIQENTLSVILLCVGSTTSCVVIVDFQKYFKICNKYITSFSFTSSLRSSAVSSSLVHEQLTCTVFCAWRKSRQVFANTHYQCLGIQHGAPPLTHYYHIFLVKTPHRLGFCERRSRYLDIQHHFA